MVRGAEVYPLHSTDRRQAGALITTARRSGVDDGAGVAAVGGVAGGELTVRGVQQALHLVLEVGKAKALFFGRFVLSGEKRVQQDLL